MKITVTTMNDKVFFLDVSADLELENFKAFCEVESGIPSAQMMVVFNGKPLLDGKIALKSYDIKDGDCVIIHHIQRDAMLRNTNGNNADLGMCARQLLRILL